MDNKAFTFIEVMLAVLIFTIIIAAVFLVIDTGRNTWFSASTYIEVKEELRKAREQMMRELVEGRYSTLDIGGADDSIVDFEIPSSVTDSGHISWQGIRYYHDQDEGQLVRQGNGNIKIVANSINSVVFTQDASDPRSLNVAITASKQDIRRRTVSFTSNIEVKLRN